MVYRRVVVTVGAIPGRQATIRGDVAKELLTIVIGTSVSASWTLSAHYRRRNKIVRDDRVCGSAYARGATRQGACRIVSGLLSQLFLLAPGTVNCGVTLAVGKVTTHDEIDLVVLSVGAFSARGVIKISCVQRRLDVAVVVFMAIARPTSTNLNAVHLARHKVHNTRNRVATIGSRCTTGQNINAIERNSRDLANVRGNDLRATRLHTAAVNEHQRSVSAKTT